jgi:hypothetical protein
MILAADLIDKLLSPHATSDMVARANAWLVAKAKDFGVAEADITDPLSYNAKEAAIAYLAVDICLAEAGQNQGAFGADVVDVYLVKMKEYKSRLLELVSQLSISDFNGSTAETDGTDTITAPLYRG